MRFVMVGFQLALAGFMALTVAVVSVREAASQTHPDKDVKLTEVTAVVEGNNAFALDLYAKLRNQEGNLFFSPYSISTALAMTYAGAKGETAAEMAKVMHFPLEQERLHPAFSKLIAGLTPSQPQDYQLIQANRLWGQQGYGFLSTFLKTTQKNYTAELEEVDFARNTEKARQTINNWVAQRTQDKIQNLLPEGILNTLTRLVLTNAIYFKAAWDDPFDPQYTRNEAFTITGSRQVQVPMMFTETEASYAALDDLQVLELTYAKGKISMVIFLPNKVDGLAELEQQLTPKNLKQWLSALEMYSNIKVNLPKFKLTSAFELNQVLSDMGMPSAFGDEADFSGLNGKQDLYITAVVHKTFVDVNEVSTEAAGATAVVNATRGGGGFYADHPFMFLIRDNQSGSILFLGRVVNPGS